MTSHIVISREELKQLLLSAHLDDTATQHSWEVRVDALPSGWLPIDQAPKDGTFVIVAAEDEYGWIREECCWNVYVEEWVTAHYQPYNRCGHEPTHFLPLIQPE